MIVFWDIAPYIDVSEVHTASIIRAMSELHVKDWVEIWERVGQVRALTRPVGKQMRTDRFPYFLTDTSREA
jgi:hypothetical protein